MFINSYLFKMFSLVNVTVTYWSSTTAVTLIISLTLSIMPHFILYGLKWWMTDCHSIFSLLFCSYNNIKLWWKELYVYLGCFYRLLKNRSCLCLSWWFWPVCSLSKCLDSLLTFRPAICAACWISSALPARLMMDVTALQLNLHSQGPPAWRWSLTGGCGWWADGGSHHSQRDCEEDCWAGRVIGAAAADEASACVLVRTREDGSDLSLRRHRLWISQERHSSVRPEPFSPLTRRSLSEAEPTKRLRFCSGSFPPRAFLKNMFDSCG